jgi:serine/threonine protein kinase
MEAPGWEGKKIGGRYQIEELLGQGGMSSVYKAFDPNLQRMVAIKLVHSHLSNNQEFVRRFEVEATAVARLRHSNIIQVYDFNHDNNIYFMVLEFVPGETLQQRIKRLNASGRHLPLDEALRFTIDICKASDYAHQRGMVHRDIKPANVMLDVNGNAILMDFGIARIMGGQQHTATGAVLGTALYMSPEQIQGLHPDARADIYSIGVMLFESLSGIPPFEADSVMTLMMMHMKDPVPDIETMHPGIPHALKVIINKALEKDRANRYQSAADMAAELQKVLDGLTVKSAKQEPATFATMLEMVPDEPAPSTATIIEEPKEEASFATIIQPPVVSAAAQETTQALLPEDAAVLNVGKKEPKPASPQKAQAVKEHPKLNLKLIIPIVAVLALALIGGGLAVSGAFTPRSTEPVAAAVISSATQAPPAIVTAATELVVAPPVEEPTATEAPLPTASATEAPTAAPTEEPTATLTPEPKAPVIGGADKIAFVNGGNVWAANLDGSELQQLTSDGTIKKYLRWLPGGQGLSYISGKCLYTISLSGESEMITCFNNAQSFDSFEVSPDGLTVAISVDVQLYLLPYDLERLAQVNNHPKLAAMADCTDLAPYQRNAVYQTRWSEDGKELAIVIMGVIGGGRRGDIVQIIPVGRCIPNPLISIGFPADFFTFREYERDGKFTGLTWDGQDIFAFNGGTRNDGFGDLHFFNRKAYKADLIVNPIDKACCYRDPQFSPDDTYLLFAFQDIRDADKSTTRIYYIPYGTIGTGAKYDPLPIPEFMNPKEQPQAILRKAASN